MYQNSSPCLHSLITATIKSHFLPPYYMHFRALPLKYFIKQYVGYTYKINAKTVQNKRLINKIDVRNNMHFLCYPLFSSTLVFIIPGYRKMLVIRKQTRGVDLNLICIFLLFAFPRKQSFFIVNDASTL